MDDVLPSEPAVPGSNLGSGVFLPKLHFIDSNALMMEKTKSNKINS